MPDIENLVKTANDLPERLAGLAAQLEKGQAVAPLQEAAMQLLDFPRRGHELTLVLLGMTPEARAVVLNWLMGPQHQSVSVKLSEPLDLLEIRLQERGYMLETELTGRCEYANPDDFLEALAQNTGMASIDAALLEPVRLGLAAPPPLRNLTLLAPANPGIVNAAPRLLSTIAGRTAVLVLAAPGDYPWTNEEKSSVAMIAENALAIWPVATGESTAPGTVLQYLAQQLSTPTLPLQLLTNSRSAYIPEFIAAGPAHPLRQAITLAAYARRCRSLLEMIDERFQTDYRQMESRHKREARLERSVGAAAREQDSKAAIDRYKAAFNEELGRLAQTLRENGRRSLMKSGELGQVLEQLLSSLHSGDLEREIAHKTVRLSLKPEVLASFRKRLAKALRHQVDEECVLIRDTLDTMRQASEQVLAECGATSRSLALVAPDNRALWETLGEALQLDIRYRGELPRRGFWQRLAEGRRIVFVAMMLLSLVGGFVGFNVRQIGAFGFVFLLLFIGAVIYTYTSWHKEENENLDKEIDKVRENIQSEFSRTLTDILRDKQSRLQQILDDLKKDGAQQLDNALREAQRNHAQAAETELRDAKAKLRVIEQRLKELKPLAQQIAKLGEEIERFGHGARQWIGVQAQAGGPQ